MVIWVASRNRNANRSSSTYDPKRSLEQSPFDRIDDSAADRKLLIDVIFGFSVSPQQ